MPRNGLSRPRNEQLQPDRRQVPGASLTWHPEVPVRSGRPRIDADEILQALDASVADISDPEPAA